MQIKELQIANFGNLSDKTIKLNNGLNIIHGLNESRKIYFDIFY